MNPPNRPDRPDRLERPDRQRRWLLAVPACIVWPAVHAHGPQPHAPRSEALPPVQTDWGIAGVPRAAKRTIDVVMGDDMRFSPSRIDVRLGETLRFRIRNTGRLMHEFVIGTPAENAKHAELMVKYPDMAHDEPYMAHVAPGQTGEIVWRFNRAGTFEFACLIAGHYAAGMVGTIHVKA